MPATGSRVRCRTPSPCSLKSSYASLRDTFANLLIPMDPIIENRADLFCQEEGLCPQIFQVISESKYFWGQSPFAEVTENSDKILLT